MPKEFLLIRSPSYELKAITSVVQVVESVLSPCTHSPCQLVEMGTKPMLGGSFPATEVPGIWAQMVWGTGGAWKMTTLEGGVASIAFLVAGLEDGSAKVLPTGNEDSAWPMTGNRSSRALHRSSSVLPICAARGRLRSDFWDRGM